MWRQRVPYLGTLQTHTHQVTQRLGREWGPGEERLGRERGPGEERLGCERGSGEETPWQQGKEIAAWSTRLGRSPRLQDL